MNTSLAKRYTADYPLIRLGGKLPLSIKGVGKTRATVISGEGDLISYANENDVEENNSLIGDRSVGLCVEPDVVAFRTLAADTALTGNGFPIYDEFDMDRPTEGFSSIPEAIEDIRQGKVAYFLSSVLLQNLLALELFRKKII